MAFNFSQNTKASFASTERPSDDNVKVIVLLKKLNIFYIYTKRDHIRRCSWGTFDATLLFFAPHFQIYFSEIIQKIESSSNSTF